MENEIRWIMPWVVTLVLKEWPMVALINCSKEKKNFDPFSWSYIYILIYLFILIVTIEKRDLNSRCLLEISESVNWITIFLGDCKTLTVNLCWLLTASSCYGNQNDGVMIAAASDAIWGNRAACGRMYRVRCTGATNQGVPQPCKSTSVVVKIVDYCPPGCQGTIDLSQETFSAIANTDAGKIKIECTQ